MVELQSAFFADYARVDGNGKVNALGVFSHVVATEFPASVPALFFVLFLAIEPEDSARDNALRISITNINAPSPSGPAFIDAPIALSVPDGFGELSVQQIVMGMEGLTFADPGMYIWDIYVNGEPKGRSSLLVMLKASEN